MPDRRDRRDPARRRDRRRSSTAAARAQGTPLADRRLPRRHAEDRVEGRGPARRSSTPTTSTARHRLVESESVRIVRRRGDLVISETRARLRVRERGHRPVERRSRARRAAAGRPRPLGEAHPRRVARARRRRRRGRHLRHVRAPVAARAHRRRDRRERHRRGRRPARDARRARPRSCTSPRSRSPTRSRPRPSS